MKELNLLDLFKYYLRHFAIIFLTVILSLLIGYLYIEYFQIPKYKGVTSIILVEKSDNGVSNILTQNEIIINEKLVTTYSEIIKSKRVLNRVIKDLDLNISIEDLAELIEVSDVQDTSIIKVEVINKNNKKATDIANKIAEVFKDEITQIYNLENVSIIDEAVIEDEPYNVNIPVQLAIYSSIGFGLSILIILVKYYFNNAIKDKKEIESNLKIPVLGEIPVTSKLMSRKKQKSKKIKLKKYKKEADKKLITKKVKSQKSPSKNKDTKKKTNTSKTVAKNNEISKKSPSIRKNTKSSTTSESSTKKKSPAKTMVKSKSRKVKESDE